MHDDTSPEAFQIDPFILFYVILFFLPLSHSIFFVNIEYKLFIFIFIIISYIAALDEKFVEDYCVIIYT